MDTILLALIAGLLLVLAVKTDKPQIVAPNELFLVVLTNYLIPLAAALICAAVFLGIAYGLQTLGL